MKAKIAASKVTSLFDDAEEVGGVKIASAYFTGTSGDTLRGMCDTVRDKAVNPVVAVLVGKAEDKITMAVTVNKMAQEKGLKAGRSGQGDRAIAGGKGGGKPDFAMAGLKDENKIDEALAAVRASLRRLWAEHQRITSPSALTRCQSLWFCQGLSLWESWTQSGLREGGDVYKISGRSCFPWKIVCSVE